MINVIVLFPKREVARNIRNLLVRNGFEVVGVCTTGAQVVQRVEEMGEGLVICGYKCSDMIYSELREYLPDRIWMLLLASRPYLADCQDLRIQKLAMPLKGHELIIKTKMIIEEIAQEQKRRRSKPKQRSREEVELLENVKQLLMDNNRISEEEAHSYIQQRSMNSGVGLIEMAKMIKESFIY